MPGHGPLGFVFFEVPGAANGGGGASGRLAVAAGLAVCDRTVAGGLATAATFVAVTAFVWCVATDAPAVAALMPSPALSPTTASAPIPTALRFFSIDLPPLNSSAAPCGLSSIERVEAWRTLRACCRLDP